MSRSSAALKKQSPETYPPGTTFSEWYVAREGGAYKVKRMVTLPDGHRTAQRAPAEEYRPYLTQLTDREKEIAAQPGVEPFVPRALEDYVIRLNGKDPRAERLKREVRFDHAWINDEFLQAYKTDVLYQSMQDRQGADALFAYLNRYALTWFLTRKRAITPRSWKEHEKEWGRYLLNQEADQKGMADELRLFRDKDDDQLLTPRTRQLSAKVLKQTLYEMNRFIRYIYDRRRGEFDDRLIQLQPWGDSFLEGYAANWRVKHQPRPSKFIREAHWQVIAKAMLEKEIVWRHQVHLAHDYGLRRRETMGLDELSAKPSYLHLLQQLHRCVKKGGHQVREFKGLKGKETERLIPHWFAEPKVTRARIRAMLSQEIPHPDTISRGFRDLVRSLRDDRGQPLPDYIFHDLRRTFVTNAVRKEIKLADLMLATGHKSEDVLARFYRMDDRELEQDFDLGEDDDDIVV